MHQQRGDLVAATVFFWVMCEDSFRLSFVCPPVVPLIHMLLFLWEACGVFCPPLPVASITEMGSCVL